MIVIFISGLVLRLLYLIHTPFDTRSYDALSHLEYIQYISHHWQIPAAQQGWEFYQPPLYYLIAALVNHCSQLFHLSAPLLLQFLSLFFFMLMLGYAYLIIKQIIRSKSLRWLVFALVVFWPSGIIHSVRIGNDPLQYLTMAVSLYFFVLWWKHRQIIYLDYGFIWANLSTLVKLNGAIMLFACSIGYLIHLRRFSLSRKTIVINLLVSIVMISLTLIIVFRNNLFTKQSALIVGNIGNLNSALRVGNHPGNYLGFDLKTFITQPYTSPWNNDGGRQYFSNYLLKTSLFGEFEFNQPLLNNIARLISGLLLLMLGFSLMSMIFNLKRSRPAWVHYFVFLLMLASALTARILYPFSSTNDFRYLFPIIIPTLVIYGFNLENFGDQWGKIWKRTGVFVGWSMVYFSGLFFLLFSLISP